MHQYSPYEYADDLLFDGGHLLALFLEAIWMEEDGEDGTWGEDIYEAVDEVPRSLPNDDLAVPEFLNGYGGIDMR